MERMCRQGEGGREKDHQVDERMIKKTNGDGADKDRERAWGLFR